MRDIFTPPSTIFGLGLVSTPDDLLPPAFGWVDHTYVRPWKDEPGHTQCIRCNQPAIVHRDGHECHACRDWAGCGGGCRQWAVSCPTCGAHSISRPEHDGIGLQSVWDEEARARGHACATDEERVLCDVAARFRGFDSAHHERRIIETVRDERAARADGWFSTAAKRDALAVRRSIEQRAGVRPDLRTGMLWRFDQAARTLPDEGSMRSFLDDFEWEDRSTRCACNRREPHPRFHRTLADCPLCGGWEIVKAAHRGTVRNCGDCAVCLSGRV